MPPPVFLSKRSRLGYCQVQRKSFQGCFSSSIGFSLCFSASFLSTLQHFTLLLEPFPTHELLQTTSLCNTGVTQRVNTSHEYLRIQPLHKLQFNETSNDPLSLTGQQQTNPSCKLQYYCSNYNARGSRLTVLLNNQASKPASQQGLS